MGNVKDRRRTGRPVSGGRRWVDYARKKDPYTRPVGEHWITRAQGKSGILSNRILAAGQHRGSTSAIRTALNALVAN
jgi:hypothetical protein